MSWQGKSALVNEIHKPITAKRGNFISGKYDQFQRNIPYDAIAQAFNDFCNQLLTESEAVLRQWQEKILAAVGNNGQVLIDVISNLELIIGKQIPVPLSAQEAQNRFNLVFQNFIKAICQPEHPLVLFIDDLQWADSGSLKLLKTIMSDRVIQNLLIVGAYRDNEVNGTHPFIMAVEEIEKAGGVVLDIHLDNLTPENVNALIADTLECSTIYSQPLTDLIYQKTLGNAFFTTEFLKSLYTESLLTFNRPPQSPTPLQRGVGRWQWDIKQIIAKDITNNVVELMAGKICILANATQKILQLAACIGNSFDLSTLSIISEHSHNQVVKYLLPALQEGLIIPLNEQYKLCTKYNSSTNEAKFRFLHDRVQQAAYSLIKDEQKQKTHFRIGKLILKNTKKTELSEAIFDIVNHLNAGINIIIEPSIKIQLAELNLIAGRKAKTAIAYAAAVNYLKVGRQALAEDSWQSQYELTLALYTESTETCLLNNDFEQMEQLATITLAQAKNLLDKIKIYLIQIQSYTAQYRFSESLELGLQVLEMLDVKIAELKDNNSVVFLPNYSVETIPEMTDSYKLAAMQILSWLLPTVFTITNRFPDFVFTLVKLSLEFGNSPLASYSYAAYGMLLCALGNIEVGYKSGKLGLKLLEKYDNHELKCKVHFLFYAHTDYCKNHIKLTCRALVETIQIGIDNGDIEYACFAALHYCLNTFLLGEKLQIVNQEQKKYIELIASLRQDYSKELSSILQQLVDNLLGISQHKTYLIGESFNEEKRIPELVESNNHTSLVTVYVCKIILYYLYQEYEQAVLYAERASKHTVATPGMLWVPIHNFFWSLAILAYCRTLGDADKHKYLAQVELNQEKLKIWAFHAPMNFQHKYELVEAEKARVLGQILEAEHFYEQAISGARNNGYIQEEALAYELAANFYLARGMDKIAQTYIKEAYFGYTRWQAWAKVKDLQQRYPLLTPSSTDAQVLTQTSTTIEPTNSTTLSKSLDISSFLKASQALAREIKLDTLLAKMMKIIIENAGASKGYLILQQNGQWTIAAQGSLTQELVGESTPIEIACDDETSIVSSSIINYVIRTQETLVFNDAANESNFTQDAYIKKHQPKSLLCTPIINQGKLIGLLYLENNQSTGAFSGDRLLAIKLLTTQAAISLENALLYQNLEQKVIERTQELHQKNQDLQQTLQELQRTQAQLIQTEKMSSLGQMVAGIAHEINNPITFIHGNLAHVQDYVQDLLNLIALYEQEYDTTPKIQEFIEEINIDFITQDLDKIINSMQGGSKRIRDIILGLRNFSRLDEAEIKPVDIHEGIDSTLMILQHRLRCASQPEIQIIKEYAKLPLVNCYANQLNQVFLNILSNAIEALQTHRSTSANPSLNPQIRIYTELESKTVRIGIVDNGPGMSESLLQKIFDPFFTTKPVGSGTGLGLSISYSIVVEKHRGKLTCKTALGQGAEFVIEIPTNLEEKVNT